MKVWVAPGGLHIEPAAPEDASQLARLHDASFYKGWPVEDFTAYIGDPKRTPVYVVCDARRRIAGFAVFRAAADSADLLTIAVDRRHRGRGIGKALLKTTLEDLMMSGVTHVTLEVDESNLAAIRMYESHGFVRVSRRAGYYADTEGGAASALVLRRDLE